MPWFQAPNADGQTELVFVPKEIADHCGEGVFAHLPRGVPDDHLVVCERPEPLLWGKRHELADLARYLATDEAEQEARDKVQGVTPGTGKPCPKPRPRPAESLGAGWVVTSPAAFRAFADQCVALGKLKDEFPL
jgi:hypothetical protein